MNAIHTETCSKMDVEKQTFNRKTEEEYQVILSLRVDVERKQICGRVS